LLVDVLQHDAFGVHGGHSEHGVQERVFNGRHKTRRGIAKGPRIVLLVPLRFGLGAGADSGVWRFGKVSSGKGIAVLRIAATAPHCDDGDDVICCGTAWPVLLVAV
jgi:hypothetical protein